METSERSWLRRVVADETRTAYLLLGVAVFSVLLGNTTGGAVTTAVQTPFIGHLSLAGLASEWGICIFFLVAGSELGHELRVGALAQWQAALPPVAAAVAGMLLPGAIYSALAPAAPFGLAIATDLPLALTVLVLAGRGLPIRVRAFLLALAIVDDLLAVVVLAFTGAGGLHPAVVAAAVGVLLPLRTSNRVRDLLQPWSALVALPLFVFTSLAVALPLPDLAALWQLPLSRIVGKTAGVLLAGALAQRILRPAEPLRLNELAAVGAVASLGFTVSLLFAAQSPASSQAEFSATVLYGLIAAAVWAAGMTRTAARTR